jgi:hypothetical protein
MTPREGFKFYFYYRCAEEGLSADEARDRARSGLEKRAIPNPLPVLWGGAKTMGALGLAGAVGIPAVAGAGIGLGLANAQEHDVDPDEIRRQELIATLNFHADQARRRAAMKNLRAGVPPR